MQVGPYQLGECIGEGGLARVFRSTGPDGRSVAVKLLNPRSRQAQSPSALVRFEREIDTLTRIRHHDLLELLDHGVDEEHGPFLVTPLIEGVTLREAAAGKALGPEYAMLVVHALLAPLAALHAEALVHRDLKPENVMVTPDGRVVLVDLGLAYHEDHTRCTEEGAVAGSVPYMSPEQLEGGTITPASDVFSTGVVLYELVTGRRPFARDRASEEVGAILAAQYEPLGQRDRRVGAPLSALVDEMLASAADQRPANAAIVRQRIAEMFDWFGREALASELRAALSDTVRYVETTTALRVESLRKNASSAIATGETFEAVALLDRALAYAPEDAESLRLLDAATSAPPLRAPEQESREIARSPSRAGAVALSLAVFALPFAAGFAISHARSRQTMATRSAPTHGPSLAPAGRLAGVSALDPASLDNAGQREIAAPALPELSDASAVLAAANRVLEHDPADHDALVARAGALAARNDVSAARDTLARAIAAHPETVDALELGAWLAWHAGDVESADALYTRLLALDPNDAVTYAHRGVLRAQAGRTRDAYLDLVEALRRNERDSAAAAALARIYARTGDSAGARAILGASARPQ